MLINVKVGGASHNLKLLSHHSKKRSTTPSFLNGVCGGGNQGVLLACQKRAFLNVSEWLLRGHSSHFTRLHYFGDVVGDTQKDCRSRDAVGEGTPHAVQPSMLSVG
jgi:hypothetical protein